MNTSLKQPMVFEFSSLRSDWYAANSALSRAVRRCLEGRAGLVFRGFPRQWIPIFEWFGVPWVDSIDPPEYLPFFSDLGEDGVVQIVEGSKNAKSLRILVESTTMYDPILSDFLYITDNTCRCASPAMERELQEISGPSESRRRRLLLNGWQAYGRPSLRALEAAVMSIKSKADAAVALPCSLRRPYSKSRTHKSVPPQLEMEEAFIR